MTSQQSKKAQLKIRSLESKVTPMCVLDCERMGGVLDGDDNCYVGGEFVGTVVYKDLWAGGTHGWGQLAAVADF